MKCTNCQYPQATPHTANGVTSYLCNVCRARRIARLLRDIAITEGQLQLLRRE